jgi:hypothetical protein
MFYAVSRAAALTVALLAVGVMPAAAQSNSKVLSHCSTSVENGNTRVVCSDNPDALFAKPGTLTREDVVYTKQPEAAAPVKARANFCGSNFRLAGDGTCQLPP